MPQVRPVAKIHAAAAYFAFVSRDPKQIAEAFNLKNVRTVHRWAKTEEWEEGLDACNYTGNRSFEHRLPSRYPQGEGDVSFEDGKKAYLKAIADGVPKHRCAAVAADAIGMDTRKIRDWARRYGWREETENA